MECWSVGVLKDETITPLLHDSITPPLHHSTTPLLHHSTTPSSFAERFFSVSRFSAKICDIMVRKVTGEISHSPWLGTVVVTLCTLDARGGAKDAPQSARQHRTKRGNW